MRPLEASNSTYNRVAGRMCFENQLRTAVMYYGYLRLRK